MAKAGLQRLKLDADAMPRIVSEESLQDHLVLFWAFQELRLRVTQGTDDTLPQYTSEAIPPSANVKSDSIQFVLFLHRALFRFERYVSVILAPLYTQAPLRFSQLAKANGPDTLLLPPHMLPRWTWLYFGVCIRLLTLDSYKLHPQHFYEDAFRDSTRNVLAITPFPLHALVQSLNMQYHLEAPDAAAFWEATTILPFDPVRIERHETDALNMACPFCHAPHAVPWTSIVSPSWTTKCSSCIKTWGVSELLGFRLVSDLEKWADGGDDRTGFRLCGGVLSAKDSRYFLHDPFEPVHQRVLLHRWTSQADMESMKQGTLVSSDKYGQITMGVMAPQDMGRTFSYNLDAIEAYFFDSVKKTLKPLINGHTRDELLRRVALLFHFYRHSHP